MIDYKFYVPMIKKFNFDVLEVGKPLLCLCSPYMEISCWWCFLEKTCPAKVINQEHIKRKKRSGYGSRTLF